MTIGGQDKSKPESKAKKDGKKEHVSKEYNKNDKFPSMKLADPETKKEDEYYKFDASKYLLIPKPNYIDQMQGQGGAGGQCSGISELNKQFPLMNVNA